MAGGKECHYFDNCFDQTFSKNQARQIALFYGVINTTAPDSSIYFGLLKGASANVPGIGTRYIKSKDTLNLQDTNWYWEIGSCATDNRIFVDALTGKAGLLQNYVYCGGMP